MSNSFKMTDETVELARKLFTALPSPGEAGYRDESVKRLKLALAGFVSRTDD